jgi:serine/threonine-protein kinase
MGDQRHLDEGPTLAAPPGGTASPTPTSGVAGERFPPGTVLAGRYRVVHRLGAGGMGEVYRADDLRLGQPVALKFLPAAVAHERERLDRLAAEVRLGRQIADPHVCRLYDIVEADGQAFVTMELVEGEDLASLVRRIGRLAPDKAAELSRQIASGLAAAHARRVLHRDLKPANVMLDREGQARITDFGLAVETSGAADGVFAGTPAYMAPEQLAGGPATVQSDLYALGLVLFELFTGRRALEGSDLAELRRHAGGATPTPASLVPDIDPQADRVVRWCLEPDPARRPESARQVLAALPGGDPVQAALALGRTPSPQAVADAGAEGRLRPAVAWTWLAAGLGLLAVAAWLSTAIQALHRVAPEEPAVLQARALRVLEGSPHVVPPRDRVAVFAWDEQSFGQLAGHVDRGEMTAADRVLPLLLGFRYLQSPLPLRGDRGEPRLLDPVRPVGGAAEVLLDTRGRLLALLVVPSEHAPPASRTAVDWRPLLAAAGVDPDLARPRPPRLAPPVFADARAAWSAPDPVLGGELAIEAASLAGAPVAFRVLRPWQEPRREAPGPRRLSGFALLLVVLLVLVTVGAVLLARRNLLAGRGDRRGASAVALVVFLSVLASRLLLDHHWPGVAHEGSLLLAAAGRAALLAGFLWLAYLALEPWLRRRGPYLLVAWARLLDGRWRDPLVGRDLLVGTAGGVLFGVANLAGSWLPRALGLPAYPYVSVFPEPLLGLRETVGRLLYPVFAFSIFQSLAFLLLVVLFEGLLRRRWAAGLAFCTLSVAAFGLSEASWPAVAAVAVMSLALTLALVRGGLLATAAFLAAFFLSSHFPATLDLSAWYAPVGLAAWGAAAALMVAGFVLALGGQPAFGGFALED